MSISITKKTSTTNTTALANRDIKYLVIHYTAGVTSKAGSAANTASWFANSSAQASADFIVDDETIVQFNPDIANRYCWHCGGSKYNTKGGSLYGIAKNSNSIGIEICSTNSTGKMTNANDSYWSYTDAVLEKALELTNYLMEKYGIDADHVIRHYDVNGKPCPGIIGWNADTGDESKWKAFKARLGGSSSSSSTTSSSTSTYYYRVRKTWSDASSQKGAFTVLANAKACCDENPGYSVYDPDGNVVYTSSSGSASANVGACTGYELPYTVKVSISNLNIRKGPGTNYDKTGKYTGVGVFTIVEESAGTGSTKGWGLLKSYQSDRSGWVSLDYCTKV